MVYHSPHTIVPEVRKVSDRMGQQEGFLLVFSIFLRKNFFLKNLTSLAAGYGFGALSLPARLNLHERLYIPIKTKFRLLGDSKRTELCLPCLSHMIRYSITSMIAYEIFSVNCCGQYRLRSDSPCLQNRSAGYYH